MGILKVGANNCLHEVPDPSAKPANERPCSTRLVERSIRSIGLLLETRVLHEVVQLSRVIELLESCARGRDCLAQPLQLRFVILHGSSPA